jgi:hypothetical protein
MSDQVRSGIHPLLEAAANELIYGSLRGITSQSAKSDILTPWKEQDRVRREVLSHTGSVDPAIRRGLYGRVANGVQSHLNSRDGWAGLGTSRTPGARTMEGDWPNPGYEIR